MSRNLDHVLDEIFRRIDRMEVVSTLEPKDRGSSIECICPSCNKRSAFIYKNGTSIICNKGNKCGAETPLLTWINGGTKPTGPVFLALVEKLAGKLGIDVPKRFNSPEAAEQARLTKERSDELETALAKAHEAVTGKVRDFLAKKGYKAPHSALSTDIGYVDDREVALKLSNTDPNTQDPGKAWMYRIVFAIRNKWGRLVGFTARTMEDVEPKYLHSRGLDFKAIGAVGLDQATSHGNSTGILIEGVIDVFIMRSHGQSEFIAIGGSGTAVSSDRLKLLHSLGMRKLYSLMDNDTAGAKGNESIVDNFNDAPMPDVYISNCLGNHKDPGEYAAKEGTINEMMYALSAAEHAYRYKARVLAERFDLTTDQGRNDYIRDCYNFDCKINVIAREDAMDTHFWPYVCQVTGKDIDYVLNVRDEIKTQERKASRQRHLGDALRKSQEAFVAGNLNDAISHLSDAYRSASESVSDITYAPVVRVSDRLASNTERLAERSGQSYLGLIQKTIPELDKATLGLRRMITVASGPGTGKTIFISQLMQDVLTHQEDACALMVSWELTGDEIIDRMKSRSLGLRWKDLQLRSTAEQREQADELLSPIADRMVILEPDNCPDEEMNVPRIIAEIKRLKRDTGCKRCIVLVDYLQILPMVDDTKVLNENARDNALIREMKKIRFFLKGDPLIIVSEMNKNDGDMAGRNLSKIKGSGRTAYGSDCAFFLNTLSDQLLYENVTMHNGVPMPKSKYGTDEPIAKKDVPKIAEEIREHLKGAGKDYLELYIPKIRDGGTRQSILLTNFHELSRMESGIQ